MGIPSQDHPDSARRHARDVLSSSSSRRHGDRVVQEPGTSRIMPVLFGRPHEKFIGHMEAGLKRLKSAAASGRLRDERLGRLKEHFWRASQAFDVKIRKLPQPIGKQHLEVSWVRNEKFHEWSQLVDGC